MNIHTHTQIYIKTLKIIFSPKSISFSLITVGRSLNHSRFLDWNSDNYFLIYISYGCEAKTRKYKVLGPSPGPYDEPQTGQAALNNYLDAKLGLSRPDPCRWTALCFSSSVRPSSFSMAIRRRYWGLDSISRANWAARSSRWRNSSELSFSKGTLRGSPHRPPPSQCRGQKGKKKKHFH